MPPTATLLIGLALLAAAVCAALAGWFWHRAERYRREVERHWDALCRLEPRNLHSDNTAAELPPLSPRNPWRSTAERLRETLLERSRQVREMEHARAALEIRCRRATTDYEKIKALLEGLGEPILVIDDYGEIVLANAAAENLFHFRTDELESRLLAQVVECQKLVRLVTGTARRATATNRAEEIELPDAEGNNRWYRVTATKLRPTEREDGVAGPGTRGTIAVLRDIGEQKNLRKRNAEFVSAVSHEMKTPLAGIKAYVELLADGDAEDEETREEFLGVIDSQADRLQRLVENMLNLARIEAGVVKVSKEAQSLNELLEQALDVVRPAAEAKRIELTSDLSPMYLGVLVDRDMLLQAAINLLSNAVKYTPEKGRVILRSRLDDHGVRFEVEDTGVGLSEEDCRRVFDKFYRVGAQKNMASGTGLGLPLAKHIVEDVHGGHLRVKSLLGQGSTFSITLPCAGQLT